MDIDEFNTMKTLQYIQYKKQRNDIAAARMTYIPIRAARTVRPAKGGACTRWLVNRPLPPDKLGNRIRYLRFAFIT